MNTPSISQDQLNPYSLLLSQLQSQLTSLETGLVAQAASNASSIANVEAVAEAAIDLHAATPVGQSEGGMVAHPVSAVSSSYSYTGTGGDHTQPGSVSAGTCKINVSNSGYRIFGKPVTL